MKKRVRCTFHEESNMMMSSASNESSPLLGRRFAFGRGASCSGRLEEDPTPTPSSNERRKNTIGMLFLHAGCILVGYLLNTSYNPMYTLRSTADYEDSILASFGYLWGSPKSPYAKVQTLSFQIYTGGAPAFKHNHECIGCKLICIIWHHLASTFGCQVWFDFIQRSMIAFFVCI